MALGATVKVKGFVLDDGSVQAVKVEVAGDGGESGGGGPPLVTSFSVLHLVPTAAMPEAEGVVITRLFMRADGGEDEDLKVAVEALAPDALYDVVVDGLLAGVIHVSQEGGGKLFLSSREIPGSEPLPAELRPVDQLSRFEVIDSFGVIVLAGDSANQRRHSRTQPGTEYVAAALLWRADGDLAGVVMVRATEKAQQLTLRAWGLDPFASIAVVVDSVPLASLEADGKGDLTGAFGAPPKGNELLLPDSFLPISSLLRVELRASDGTLLAAGALDQALASQLASPIAPLKRKLRGR